MFTLLGSIRPRACRQLASFAIEEIITINPSPAHVLSHLRNNCSVPAVPLNRSSVITSASHTLIVVMTVLSVRTLLMPQHLAQISRAIVYHVATCNRIRCPCINTMESNMVRVLKVWLGVTVYIHLLSSTGPINYQLWSLRFALLTAYRHPRCPESLIPSLLLPSFVRLYDPKNLVLKSKKIHQQI
jgi:hypothetical protein